jgi:hypothetical protein
VKLYLEITVMNLGGTAQLIQEIHMPSGAAKFPVSDTLETYIFLQLDRRTNRSASRQ